MNTVWKNFVPKDGEYPTPKFTINELVRTFLGEEMRVRARSFSEENGWTYYVSVGEYDTRIVCEEETLEKVLANPPAGIGGGENDLLGD